MLKNKKILNLFFIVILYIFTFESAFSHGPSRQKVVEKISFSNSIDEVWAIISKFDDFSWNSDISKTVSTGNEIGSTRILTFKSGETLTQSLEKFNSDKKLISWRVQETDLEVLPVNSYQATLILKENTTGTELTYKAGFYRGFMGNNPPEKLNDENSKKKVKTFIKNSIDGLKKILE